MNNKIFLKINKGKFICSFLMKILALDELQFKLGE